MARISGVELPHNKRIETALRYIYGVGPTNSLHVLVKAKVKVETRTHELTSDEVNRIQKAIEELCIVEGDLRREVLQNIRRKQMAGTYQGLRHKAGLPVRGQRTRHNARTRRGKRKTVGTVRKEVAQKKG
jgi:small subunit ribosomal protein S13